MTLPPISQRASDGMKETMRSEDGRFFLARLLRLTGVYARGPKQNEAIATYLGRRAVGIDILDWMAALDPDFEPDLMKEIRAYDRALDEQRRRDGNGRDGTDGPDRRPWHDPDGGF